MRELEKIFKEIREYENHVCNEVKIVGYIAGAKRAIRGVEEIIRKYMKNEEDIIKFYYCESEDDYYLGQRVQNMYYAKYKHGSFTWFMSRYLPWGTDGYPSEPKEIPFIEWIDGFIRKHDGWIPVERGLPEEGEKVLVWYEYFRYGEYNRMYETYGISYQYDGYWSGDVSGTKAKCIAWRHLPEPYRPERSESKAMRELGKEIVSGIEDGIH